MPINHVPVSKDISLDWIKIAAQASDGHRSAEECQYMWNALLSTNISQSEFSEKDDIAIQVFFSYFIIHLLKTIIKN